MFETKLKRQGEFKRWRDGGQVLARIWYEDGERHGEFKAWYDDGELWDRFLYNNGKKIESYVGN